MTAHSTENTILREHSGGWEPRTPLHDGIKRPYRWIESEYPERSVS
ncbi:MAG: hypothetical protein GY772_28395 [bacterium]|jgi:nucleoside-diphosphate-sugar epimerase|nr:hypothetical protein [bacterium]